MTREYIKRIAAFILASTAVVACGSDQTVDSSENTDTAQSAILDALAGFEFNDGNLAPAAPINFDWNSFSPTTWNTNPAPNRRSTKIVNGWSFVGIEDAQAVGTDGGFAGGTKQNDQCPAVINAKAANKDDLKRIYIASKMVGTNVQLALGWVRIPQNTTSASAHVGFEFNKGTTPCSGGSGLVQRSSGDMLLVYDFEGGSAVPTIRLSRWLLATDAGTCATGAKPCWSTAKELTALLDSNGNPIAEAKVSTGTVSDTIGPSPENLGVAEFGEAGINLTAAGVFQPGVCDNFGKAFGVSRSSGSSDTAQMKDLAGPADVHISNCGSIKVVKQTDPSPDPTDSTFTFTPSTNLPGGPFDLKNGGFKQYNNVLTGTYTVTETPNSKFSLTAVDCQGASTTVDLGLGKATINLAAGQDAVCTFKNKLKTGSIQIIKVTAPDPDPTNTTFSFTASAPLSPTSFTLQNGGSTLFSNVVPGTYTFTENNPNPLFSLTSLTCNSPNVTVDLASNQVIVNLAAGENVICTYTDTLQTGTITIVKETNPSPDPTGSTFNFTASGGLSPAGFSLQNGGSNTYNNVVPGTYTITESDPGTLFSLNAIVCQGATTAVDLANRKVSITIAPGQSALCTFKNNLNTGSIKIAKVTDPSPDPTGSTFSFAATGLTPASFNLKNGDFNLYPGVVPGTYTFTESNPGPNFALTAISCDSAAVSVDLANRKVTVTLAASQNVTCTFNNKLQTGSIKIVKVTDPSPDPTGSTFAFAATPGLTPASFGLKNGQFTLYNNVVPGGYTFTESNPGPNFALTAISCDSAAVTVNLGARNVLVNLAPSQNVTCTFTNKLQTGVIKIMKISSKDGSGLAGAVFAIDGNTTNTFTTGANGTVCVPNLLLGNHTVTEIGAPAGYSIDETTPKTVAVVASSCSDVSPPTVSFSDTPLSRITVSFESLAAGNPTSATIKCTPMDTNASPLPEGTPRVLDNLLPGTYTCEVIVDP